MKKSMLITAMALAFAVSTNAAIPQPEKATATAATVQLKPAQAQTQAAVWASMLLARHHYKAVPLDDAMSEKIFDRYFKSLDGEKIFFVQSDIDQFETMRTRFDDAIRNEDIRLPFAIYSIYMQRFSERIAHARELLKTRQDFTTDERFQLDREKAAWAKDQAELDDLWRKRVKDEVLRLKIADKAPKDIQELLA